MRPPVKGQDPYGRGRSGQQQQRPGEQPQQRPGYGQPPTEQKKQQPPPPPANLRGDVVWAVRNASVAMSIFDISSKITAAGKTRYGETKIQHILEMLVADGKVNKGGETGRVTYKWAVEEV